MDSDLLANQTSNQALSLSNVEQIVEHLPSGVVILAADGRIHYANQAAENLLGQSLTHKSWISIVQTAFAPRSDDGHEISLRNGRRVKIDLQSLAPNPGELILLTDLTATRDWQEQLNQESRLLTMGRMTAHLAHQIRTPLSSAILYCNHLTDAQLPDDKREQFQQKVLHCLNDIEHQIQDMLVFAKGGNTVLSETSINELLINTYQLAEAQLQQRNIQFRNDNQVGDLSIQCHKESLQGALLNLIHNAINALPEQGEIVVKVCYVGDQWLDFIVQDNGAGMSEQMVKKVMQPFFTTRAKGTGLGLAVVQAVAQSHQGSVWIESTPEQGSRVGIRIPVINQRGSTDE